MQFLNVIDRDQAHRRFDAAIHLAPLGEIEIALDEALGRVLSRDVAATIDVPSFDRSNFDGFAVRAADTFDSSEFNPSRLQLLAMKIATGVVPPCEITPGSAVSIATGGMLPRGADAIVMVEIAEQVESELLVQKAVTPGFGISHAGSDIAAAEVVLHAGQHLTSRETGVLAAIGQDRVHVWRRVRVAIVSTGDEIIAPGQPMQLPGVYDSNGRILADAVRELGAEPIELGIVRDDLSRLQNIIDDALATADLILLSGGTSKGEGDLCYRAIERFNDPGIVVHGVALKPGKPICLAVTAGKPVVILPGFPTSAIFTFHEFVAPVIRKLGGAAADQRNRVRAKLAAKVNSVVGRTEFLLVRLVEGDEKNDRGAPRLTAYPMGKGSGSVTSFSQADGFIAIDRYEEIIEADSPVDVTRLGRDTRVADLVVMGSHCVGLALLLSHLQRKGFQTKSISVGSTVGLEAALRGECDVAGIHLLDEVSGQYNQPFLTDKLELIPGYGRMQGIVFRADDSRFSGRSLEELKALFPGADCRMVNRNRGSGTRILIDQLLDGSEPAGYSSQTKSHAAVAAAVTQGRADWGVAIETVARTAGLGFLPLTEEKYDFMVPKSRLNRPAVQALIALLKEPAIQQELRDAGFLLGEV